MTGGTGRSEDLDDQVTVLVADDERDLADLYAAWLSDSFDVRVAYDGTTALEQLDQSVDVVLLDRRMPSFSGDEILRRIREEDYDCSVIMVTAVEPDTDIVSMGFDEYLQKPVNKEELLGTIDRVLRRSAYDSTLQSYYSAVRKRTLLDERLAPGERDESDEYRLLLDEIKELESAIDRSTENLDQDDYEALFQQFD